MQINITANELENQFTDHMPDLESIFRNLAKKYNIDEDFEFKRAAFANDITTMLRSNSVNERIYFKIFIKLNSDSEFVINAWMPVIFKKQGYSFSMNINDKKINEMLDFISEEFIKYCARLDKELNQKIEEELIDAYNKLKLKLESNQIEIKRNDSNYLFNSQEMRVNISLRINIGQYLLEKDEFYIVLTKSIKNNKSKVKCASHLSDLRLDYIDRIIDRESDQIVSKYQINQNDRELINKQISLFNKILN